MESKSLLPPTEKRVVVEEEEVKDDDLISLLPDDILTKILSRLHLTEAAKTSILSKRWRYLWASVPNLNFLSIFIKYFSEINPPDEEIEKAKSSFNDIIVSRRAHVHTCNLPVFDGFPVDTDEFFSLIRALRVKDFVLSNLGGGRSRPLSPNLFSCDSLNELVIAAFSVVLPPHFNQLANLRTLKLVQVDISDDQLDVLVSGCPNLEDLRLRWCVGVYDLAIRSKSLLSLNISMYELMYYSLINAPKLEHVGLTYLDPEDYYTGKEQEGEEEEEEYEEFDEDELDEAGNVINLLMSLDHLKCFSINSCAKLFGHRYTHLQDSLPIGHHLVHMMELRMTLDFDDAKMLSLLLFLLRSCPNLQQLALKDGRWRTGFYIESDYWEKQRPPECLLYHIKTMRIDSNFKDPSSKNVFGFLKFLLLNAHVLTKMTVSANVVEFEESFLQELFRFKRASPHVLFEIKPSWMFGWDWRNLHK